jgi:GntR family transcriptional regulator, rspAB operon transcriptional repressor
MPETRKSGSVASLPSGVTLADCAHEILKRAILRAEIREGSFISEREAMEKYGISRTPFREACNRLHHEGLLEAVARRGYMVSEMSFVRVRELFEVRILFEGVVAEQAALRAEPGQIDELECLMRKAAGIGDVADGSEIIQANTEFHLCLARMAQNSELLKVMTAVLERDARIMYIQRRSSRFQSNDFERMHKPIVEAIRLRDPRAAREAVVLDISDSQIRALGASEKPGGIRHS